MRFVIINARNTEEQKMEKVLRIATYNIAHGIDYTDYKEGILPWRDLPVRLDKTAEVIRSLDACVVGLNEVFDSGEEVLVNQAGVLAEKAGKAYHAFGEAICFEREIPARYGNAMISDYKMLSVRTVKVPSPKGAERRENENGYYEDRVVLCVTLDVEGVEVTVLSAHFGLNLMEMERMTDAIVKILDEVKTPVVLMGDFNTLPHSAVLQPIYDRLQSAADAVGSTDFTFASYAPDRTIDYIFLSKEFTVKSLKAVDNRTSDHRPLVAEVGLKV